MTPPLATIISEISSIKNSHIKILSGPLKGGSNTVYEIQSEQGDRWCLRIPHDADAASFATKGTAILEDVKKRRPALLAPAIIYQSDYYTVMEYLDGEALKSWNTQVLPKERRQDLLDGLATFLFSLWTLEEVQDTQGTENSFEMRSTKDFSVRLKETPLGGDPIYYLYRRVKIDDLVPYPDDGVAIVKHGDLNAWNVVVSERGLSGVVNWDTSRFMPAPSAIHHPLFIADIPGWLNDDVPEGMTFEEDRSYLEHAIKKLDVSSEHPGQIEHLLRTSFERQFLEMSLRNREINDDIKPTKPACLKVTSVYTGHSLMPTEWDHFLDNPPPSDKPSCGTSVYIRGQVYHLGNVFVKRTLRPSEYQRNINGVLYVPRAGNERLANEAARLTFIRQLTDIPIPKLICDFEDNECHYVIMEYVEDVAMSCLKAEQKERVESELKQHLTTLHNLRSKRPGGPIGVVIPPCRVSRVTDNDEWHLKASENKEYVFCHNYLS
ncbi:uncharacterized protein BP5553_04678 [Venustampulla echinocandica]|uniref:Aminoglycoside phosphotransferase domain-containing protein n=1 Tax=Venustampulla echinocandica TaxID=2656787 RepID=A0A370TNZ7_9HELO|nr:uncharacterized protein BP5553_04678 [Venustampulla echinocandica]RDL37245.1 hypothetical protein BP5553_04678 [Venustampulla echinocandica]